MLAQWIITKNLQARKIFWRSLPIFFRKVVFPEFFNHCFKPGLVFPPWFPANAESWWKSLIWTIFNDLNSENLSFGAKNAGDEVKHISFRLLQVGRITIEKPAIFQARLFRPRVACRYRVRSNVHPVTSAPSFACCKAAFLHRNLDLKLSVCRLCQALLQNLAELMIQMHRQVHCLFLRVHACKAKTVA